MLGTEDGFALFNQIKNEDTYMDIPIIFLSSVKQPQYKIKAFELGALDYIEKSARIEEFYFRIRAKLMSIKKERELQNCSFIDELHHFHN